MHKLFRVFKLCEITQILAGGDLPDFFSTEKTDRLTIPVYSNGEKNNGLYGYTDIPKVTESAVTISARGSKVGFAAVRRQPYFPIVRLLSLIPFKDKLDVNFLFYNLKLNRQSGSGSGQPQITIPDLSNRTISVPPLDFQQKIASVLSALDDKIELNNRINAELEAMAKLVYEYWFVQFDFPISAEQATKMGDSTLVGKPYKSSGGKMVWNEELKREIPEGWEVKELKSMTTQISRGLSPTYLVEGGVCVLNQKCIRDHKINYEFARRHDHNRKDPNSRLIKRLDILVNSTGVGTLGRVGIVKWLIEETVTIDSHVTIVRSDQKKINPYFSGFSILQKQNEIEGFSLGSTGQVELSKSQLEAIMLIIPPRNVQDSFATIYSGILEKTSINEKQNLQLSSLRDWLLPMLMNGQVTVAEVEERVEEELGMVAEERSVYNRTNN